MGEPFKGGMSPTFFPMMKAGSEDAVTCIFFAVLGSVYHYRKRLFQSIGKAVYKSGNDYSCILRPSIGGRLTDKDIPDALITLNQKIDWSALVEVKIGASDLDQAQLGRYLGRALEQKVDALITISNEMCADPEMPPLRLKPAEKRLRRIKHYHWSWRFLKYQAKETLQLDSLSELEANLLRQFVEFLEHEQSKVQGYHQMPKCWQDFVDTIRDRGTPSSEDTDDVIAGWFQESADLAMILSENLDTNVVLHLEESSADLRKEAAEKLLSDDGDLRAKLVFENKSYVKVQLDIDSRCFRFETSHVPTTRVKSAHKQIERFLKMFVSGDNKDEWGDHSDVRIFSRWARKRTLTDISMSDALVNLNEDTLKELSFIDPERELKEIIVRYSPTGSASAIRNRKKAIMFLESQILYFAETYVNTEN